MITANNEQEQVHGKEQSGEEIIEGAHTEDQLDKLKEAVAPGGRDAYPERQAGAEPSTGDENADMQNTHATLATEGDLAEREENLGGTTNLSLDQLKSEGDPRGVPTDNDEAQ
jgi:hypothetical protein